MTEQIRTEVDTAGCEAIEHPAYHFSGASVLMLRKHFSSTAHLPAGLSGRRYTADRQQRTLEIVTRDEVQGHDWAARPAIVVRRNSLKTIRMGFGEGRLSLFNSSLVANHNVLYVGSHSFLCCSTTEAESTLLAFEAQQYFLRFQHHIRKGLKMLRLRVNDIGQSGLLKESRQVYATPFTVGYAYDRPFSVFPVQPAIRFVNVTQELK